VPSALPLTLQTLDPLDMLLHSATHLFYDGETDKALRDMVDLHRMMAALDAGQWARLPARAVQLELQRPLFYALRYALWLFDSPVPAAVMQAAARNGAPNTALLALMDALFERALLPIHASCDRRAIFSIKHFFLPRLQRQFRRSHVSFSTVKSFSAMCAD
jgi:hypothetical protein